jgi:hemoglobin
MSNPTSKFAESNRPNQVHWQWMLRSLAMIVFISLASCRATPAQKANANFFTSGSRDADQRASQKMAQAEQLGGSGEGSGEKGVKKAKVVTTNQTATAASGTNTNKAAKVEGKLALFDRLGGEPGISNIVADFTLRALDDPRVNWRREGVKRGGWSVHRTQSVAWDATPENIDKLKQHLVEFLELASGGPPHYTGKEIQATHANMHISNPEFDAVIGDLKASLDKLQVPNLEQKELLAIIESTRPQIVTER